MPLESTVTGLNPVSDLTLAVAAVEILLAILILWLIATALLLGPRRRLVVQARGRQYQ